MIRRYHRGQLHHVIILVDVCCHKSAWLSFDNVGSKLMSDVSGVRGDAPRWGSPSPRNLEQSCYPGPVRALFGSGVSTLRCELRSTPGYQLVYRLFDVSNRSRERDVIQQTHRPSLLCVCCCPTWVLAQAARCITIASQRRGVELDSGHMALSQCICSLKQSVGLVSSGAKRASLTSQAHPVPLGTHPCLSKPTPSPSTESLASCHE